MKKIFPDSIIDYSSAKIGNDFNKNYNLIYVTVLVAIIAAIVSIFFIKVDIVVTANGIIKAEGDRNTITSPSNGRLSVVKLQENSFVDKGDTLFVIRPDNINAQLPALNRRQEELSDFIFDVNKLINNASNRRINLRTPVYVQEHISYLNQLSDYEYNTSIAEKNFLREQTLFDADVTSAHDFELIQEK